MTVSTTIATKTYDGDGTTVNFPTTFAFYAADDIEVIERIAATGLESLLTPTTDYTVAGGGGAAGTVVAAVAPSASVSWTIRRVVAETQETDLPVAGSLPSDAIERMVDRTVMMVQQHSEALGRVLAFPKTDPTTLDPTLPSSVERAGKFLAFDSGGKPIASATAPGGFSDGSELAPGIFFESDSDTGIRKVDLDKIAIITGGKDRVTLDQDGRLSVGNENTLGTIHTGVGPKWSSHNYGVNIVIDGNRHNAIAFLDSNSDNPWAIANTSTALRIAQLPTLGDITTPPNQSLALLTGGDILIGDGTAIPNTATGGFLLIPGCLGAPTGAAAEASSGSVALVYDTLTNRLYASSNNQGNWVSVALT